MNMIRPVSDLRNNFADISKTVHQLLENFKIIWYNFKVRYFMRL